MITQVNRNQTQDKSEAMSNLKIRSTQAMTNQIFSGSTVKNLDVAAGVQPLSTGTTRTNLQRFLAQVYWRICFEAEPLYRNLLVPFSGDMLNTRLLSSKEKAEYEIWTKKR